MNEAQEWLRWWTEGYWQRADESWHRLAFFEQPAPLTERLQSLDPQLIARQLGLDARLPPAPHAQTCALLALTPPQQGYALRLVAEICSMLSPHTDAPHTDDALAEQTQLWCKRISRALRPGLWLPENLSPPWQVTVLILLRHALPTGCWQRVRFLFPAEWVVPSEAESSNTLTLNKLQPLWQAALWQASLPILASSGPAQETHHVAA